MLSRVADSIYWMSRYVERTENLARLLGLAYELELDAAVLTAGQDGEVASPVVQVLQVLGSRDEYRAQSRLLDTDGVLRYLTFDRRSMQSIAVMVALARENARATQQILGAEVWSQVNRLYLSLIGPDARKRFQVSPPQFYGRVQRSCMLWVGTIESTVVRDEVYCFLELGRYLERVELICRMLLAHCEALAVQDGETTRAAQTLRCTHLLRCASAYESFLRTHHERIDPAIVLRFLVLDGEFPRAIRFGVTRCRRALQQITGGGEDDYGSEAERLLGRLDSELRYVDVDEILDRGLAPYLKSLQGTCQRIGLEIHRAYFAA